MPEPTSSRFWPSSVWRWLRTGQRRNNSCVVVYASLSRPSRWSVPRRVWSTLRSHRGVIPVPMFYVVVGVVGLAIGVALQFTLGVWWLLPPILLLAISWLFFFTSIWWHRPGLRSTSLRTELLAIIDPERGIKARQVEEQQLLMASGLPLFEVEGWSGPVSLGGWGSSNGRLNYVALVFAEKPETPPIVTVGTMTSDGDDSNRVREHLLDELDGLVLNDELADTPDSALAAPGRVGADVRARQWGEGVIRLDGTELSAHQLRVGERSASYAAIDGMWVTVTTSHAGDFSIRTVTDPERFFRRH
ncbi:MAG: hypothetical protein ABI400_07075 [Lacisediminihabitans sp.]